jgi:alkylated DNA repair dioxygenase AlkB
METLLTKRKRDDCTQSKSKKTKITSKTIIDDEDVVVTYYPKAISKTAERFTILRRDLNWQTREIMIFGKKRIPSRLTASYGNKGLKYRYSGVVETAIEWTPELLEIKKEVEIATGKVYNFVLCNLYRDGNDYIGFHSDNEPDLDLAEGISSVSLGIKRDFRLQHKLDKGKNKSLELDPGSILYMGGDCQKIYKHSIPKRKKINGERINLTFRSVSYGEQ